MGPGISCYSAYSSLFPCFEIGVGVELENSQGSPELTFRGSDVKAHLSVFYTSTFAVQCVLWPLNSVLRAQDNEKRQHFTSPDAADHGSNSGKWATHPG